MPRPLKALLAQATPRPWKPAERGYIHRNSNDTETDAWAIFSISGAEKRPAEAGGDTAEQAEANALLIAHAVNLFPELVDFIESAKEAADNCEDSLEGLIELRGWLADRAESMLAKAKEVH